MPLRHIVHRGGRFIENDDPRVPHKGAGNGNPLALAAGEPAPVFSDGGIQPLRQTVDHILQIGHI
ncbi:hypothetical protein D3C75_1343910 [compost metagenome]